MGTLRNTYQSHQSINEIPNHFKLVCFVVLTKNNGAIYYVNIARVIFSHVKISYFRAKDHLVFHWCLYSKGASLPKTECL